MYGDQSGEIEGFTSYKLVLLSLYRGLKILVSELAF